MVIRQWFFEQRKNKKKIEPSPFFVYIHKSRFGGIYMVEKRNIIGNIIALGKYNRRPYQLSKIPHAKKFFYNFNIIENPSIDLTKIGKHDIIYLYDYPDEKLQAKLIKMGNAIIPGFIFTFEGTFDIWAYENADYLKRKGLNLLLAENISYLRDYSIAAAFKGYIKNKGVTVYGSIHDFRWHEKEPLDNFKKLGGKLNILPMEKLLDFKKIPDAESEEITEKLLSFASTGIKKEEISQAVKFYLMLKKKADLAYTTNCLNYGQYQQELMVKKSLPTPCIAAALLNEEGIGWAGEGDWISAFTAFMIQYLIESPCFMTNIYPQAILPSWSYHLQIPVTKLKENQIILCHCAYLGTSPLSMSSSWRIVTKMDLLHDRIGLMIDSSIPPGQYSLARFDTLMDSVSIFTGCLTEVRYTGTFHGRSLGVLELDYSSKVLHDSCVSHHYIVFPGPPYKLIEQLAIAGIKSELII